MSGTLLLLIRIFIFESRVNFDRQYSTRNGTVALDQGLRFTIRRTVSSSTTFYIKTKRDIPQKSKRLAIYYYYEYYYYIFSLAAILAYLFLFFVNLT